ncbi:MAG: hypothetical protein ABH817_00470 [archaeon]
MDGIEISNCRRINSLRKLGINPNTDHPSTVYSELGCDDYITCSWQFKYLDGTTGDEGFFWDERESPIDIYERFPSVFGFPPEL